MSLRSLKLSEIFYALLILALITIPGFVIAKNWHIVVQSLTVTHDPYTELYFENNEHLPLKVTTNKTFNLTHPTLALFTFQFSVHNVENKPMQYPYIVSELVNGKQTIIDTGTISLKNNEKRTISESFSAPKIYPDTKVVVELPNNNLAISFWMKLKL